MAENGEGITVAVTENSDNHPEWYTSLVAEVATAREEAAAAMARANEAIATATTAEASAEEAADSAKEIAEAATEVVEEVAEDFREVTEEVAEEVTEATEEIAAEVAEAEVADTGLPPAGEAPVPPAIDSDSGEIESREWEEPDSTPITPHWLFKPVWRKRSKA